MPPRRSPLKRLSGSSKGAERSPRYLRRNRFSSRSRRYCAPEHSPLRAAFSDCGYHPVGISMSAPRGAANFMTRTTSHRVVATAGHVDHGKSTLVQALTGIDPDRLAEEKAREMTIDLGYAWLAMPDGTIVSIIDVPGHERFIKNMLAGVGGIDAALLVIAADEGLMPQTEEHLAILDLLKIDRGA